MSFAKKYILLLLISFNVLCSNPNGLSNIFPESADKRYLNNANQGLQVGAVVSDFTLYNTNGSMETLSAILSGKKAVVVYFTMWCSFCDMHISNIRTHIKPNHPDVEFYLLDYVSASISEALSNQTAGGYSDFKTALDQDGSLTTIFNGTMGTTLVIDKYHVLKMNEDLKNGQRLSDVLNALP